MIGNTVLEVLPAFNPNIAMPRRRIILRNHLSPGDIVMLTAAVRDLHACNPGMFETDVRTTASGLWDHNPYLTPLNEGDSGVEVIECHYPLIHRSNQAPFHFIHGFEQFLSEKLKVPVAPRTFKGDIHLSHEDKNQRSQVHEIVGQEAPYWIMVAGGKNDFTIKWWHRDRYQAVVEHFKDRLLFVQIGESGHNHPPLQGVLDLRGKTNIRELVRLMYHAQGVISPVSFAMHLAAAVESGPGTPASRPCVVVAGGREPVQWEAYPHHRFLHTQGALSCCQTGGCWKARTLPLGDGDEKDKPGNLCVDVVGDLPRCMDMITPEKVIEAVESYFEGGLISFLTPGSITTNNLSSSVVTTEVRQKGGMFGDERTEYRNRVCLRLLGLRRSGIHPVLSWLAGLYEGAVCFVNDITHQDFIRSNHESEVLPGVDGKFNYGVDLQEKKRLLLLGYEDERLIYLRDNPPDVNLYGSSAELRDVLLLRDPFNTVASRLLLMRNHPGNPFVESLLLLGDDGVQQLTQRWKFLAHEFLGTTCHLQNRKILINYNQWLVDHHYRLSLCETLGVPLREECREAVPEYGFGSTFDGCLYDGRASAMKLKGRWEHFRNDPEYLSLLDDPELWELSEAIFGQLLDHEEIRRSLNAYPGAEVNAIQV